jgi:hypothetical protein
MERKKGIGLYLLVFLAGFLVASVAGPQLFPPAQRLEAATAPPPPPQDDRDSAPPPVLGAPPDASSRIEDLGQRVAIAEKRLAEMEKRFARHTHEVGGFQADRVTYFDNLLRNPDNYRNILIPYRLGPANRASSSVTGPPKY